MDAASVVEDRLRGIAGPEQLADRVGCGRALGAVAEEHRRSARVELVEVLEYLLVADPARPGDRAVPVEMLEPRIDERFPAADVLDHLELPDRPDSGGELDRLHLAPGAVDLEHPVVQGSRHLTALLASRQPVKRSAHYCHR